jgi:hypothetical protein
MYLKFCWKKIVLDFRKKFKSVNSLSINHRSVYYTSTGGLPPDLLQAVTGMTLCKNEGLSLLPLQNFHDKDIEASSSLLIQKSNTDYSEEYRLNQVWPLTSQKTFFIQTRSTFKFFFKIKEPHAAFY